MLRLIGDGGRRISQRSGHLQVRHDNDTFPGHALLVQGGDRDRHFNLLAYCFGGRVGAA